MRDGKQQFSFWLETHLQQGGLPPYDWTVHILNETVEDEIEALPDDMKARLVRIAALTEQHGLERVGEPHVKPIEGKLWEMRLKGRSS